MRRSVLILSNRRRKLQPSPEWPTGWCSEIGFDAFGSDFAELGFEEMAELGEDYGKGLQLLNILRDFPEDITSGRCYFPGSFSDPDGEMIWNQVRGYWQKKCGSLLQSSAD